MLNRFEALEQEPTLEVGEQETVDFLRFKSLVTDVKVKFENSQFQPTKNLKCASLLACSSRYGYVVVGSFTGFTIAQTANLRSTVYETSQSETATLDQVISVTVSEGAVNVLALSADECQLFIGVIGGILLTYNVQDIIQKRETAKPVQTHTMPANILHIQPNPEAHPEIVAIINEKNECQLINYMKKTVVAVIPDATAICWSPKGKQIAVGTSNGTIHTHDINGTIKDKIFPPVALKANYQGEAENICVNNIVWIENHVFLAIYPQPQGTDSAVHLIHTPYIINRKPQVEDERYTMLEEITPIYNFDTPESHFHTCVLRNFGPKAKTLIILANSGANDLAVIGQNSEGQWATWLLQDESIPTLPISDDDVTDTYPLGLAIDLSATEPLSPHDSAESEEPVAPTPVLYILTTEGLICSYHIYNDDLAKTGQKYKGMVSAKGIDQISAPTEIKSDNITTKLAGLGAISESKIPSFSALRTSYPSVSTSAFGINPSDADISKLGFSGFNFGNKDDPKVSFASLVKPSLSDSSKKQPSASGFVSPEFGNTSAFGTLSGSGNSFTLPAAATPSTPFGGYKTILPPSSTIKPFGETSSQTNRFSPQFAPSILNSSYDQRKLSQTEDKPYRATLEEDPSYVANIPSAVSDEQTIKDDTSYSMSFKIFRDILDEQLTGQGSVQSTEEDTIHSDGEYTEQKEDSKEDKQQQREKPEHEKCSEEEKYEEESKHEEEEKKLNEEHIAEEKRHQEEQMRIESERMAEEKRREDEEKKRKDEEKRREEERIAGEKKRLFEKIESTKFATCKKSSRPSSSINRTSGLPRLADEFEAAYFDTLEEVESAAYLVQDVSDVLLFQTKHTFNLKDMSELDNQNCLWALGEAEDLSCISSELSSAYEKANVSLKQISVRVLELCEAVDNLSTKKNVIENFVDEDKPGTPLDHNEFENDSANQSRSIEDKISKLEDKISIAQARLKELEQSIQMSTTNKKGNTSQFSLYSLPGWRTLN
ncbi:hypothetical protein A0J61_05105 [Choanephora cucurbitarum]|uniref:Nucleoporin Nup159/Nup146 N-terminal domain-containing protein n=1 Tax=Choanephora cucurbitarum TaxID=101091 RepID=A0A1C7NE69_9FUNG|nr:hypothetical protein A0J61_05105 [Choanephora cucurbitarum]